MGTMLGLSLLLLAGFIYYYMTNSNADSGNAEIAGKEVSTNNGIDSSGTADELELTEPAAIDRATEEEKPVMPEKRSATNNTTTNPNTAVVSNSNSTGPISFSVKGKSLSDLVAKIRAKSFQFMKNKEFTPVNPVFDEQRNTFSCTLERIPSDFVRISIAHSDGTNPCEACDAVLNNNPGSQLLADADKNGMTIQVIAVAAP